MLVAQPAPGIANAGYGTHAHGPERGESLAFLPGAGAFLGGIACIARLPGGHGAIGVPGAASTAIADGQVGFSDHRA